MTSKVKKKFVPKKKKIYLLSGKEKKISKFINKQLRKRYIRLSKSSQTVLVFFVEKKNSKKYIV